MLTENLFASGKPTVCWSGIRLHLRRDRYMLRLLDSIKLKVHRPEPASLMIEINHKQAFPRRYHLKPECSKLRLYIVWPVEQPPVPVCNQFDIFTLVQQNIKGDWLSHVLYSQFEWLTPKIVRLVPCDACLERIHLANERYVPFV